MNLYLTPAHPFWSCWADTSHRGINPTRLVMALLDCGYEEAKQIVDRENLATEIDQYEEVLDSVLHPQKSRTQHDHAPSPIKMPRHFRLLSQGVRAYHYLNYLRERGFDHVERMADYYDLRYCLTGAFKSRLIMPIYAHNRLVGWTGRDITNRARLRYATLSHKPEVAEAQGFKPAPVPIKEVVYNRDLADEKGEALAVCEGPMDAIKMDWYAPYGCHAIALFGMPEETQIAEVARLSRKYSRVLVVLDADAQHKAMGLVEQLSGACACTVYFQALPSRFKDPGELTPKAVEATFDQR